MIDKHDTRPPYIQISDQLRSEIMEGRPKPGEKLEPLSRLHKRFRVTPTTVQNALRVLKNEGLIEGASGTGVFVRKRLPMVGVSASYVAPSGDDVWASWSSEAARQGMKGTQTLDWVRPGRPPGAVSTALGLDLDVDVVIRHRTMLLDDEPVQTVLSYYPNSIAEGTALAVSKKIPGGAPKLLSKLGYPPVECTETLISRMPTVSEVRALNLAASIPVIQIFRTTFSRDNRPIEVCVLTLAANRHRLTYRLPLFT